MFRVCLNSCERWRPPIGSDWRQPTRVGSCAMRRRTRWPRLVARQAAAAYAAQTHESVRTIEHVAAVNAWDGQHEASKLEVLGPAHEHGFIDAACDALGVVLMRPYIPAADFELLRWEVVIRHVISTARQSCARPSRTHSTRHTTTGSGRGRRSAPAGSPKLTSWPSRLRGSTDSSTRSWRRSSVTRRSRRGT